MSDFWLVARMYVGFLAVVYTVSLLAGLGWKHGRGAGITINVHNHPKETHDE